MKFLQCSGATQEKVSSCLLQRAIPCGLLTRQDITRECCQEQLFQLILRLNRNKILGRLGSTKFSPPTHLVKSPDPLPTRVQNLVRNSIKARTTRRDREIERLYGQIDSFQATFRRLENGKAADVIPNIAFAIKQAYELTKDEVKLPDRLKALGCSHAMDARAVRDVGKVSNYLRVSRHLAICSQRYRPCFANAEWHPVPNYNASSRSRVLPRQHVHAEIQLLVYYEISTPQSAPRAIGASKEACFLCDSFIRAHGRFSITGAHRQMFPLWTVPDLKEYALPTIQRFRQALSLVHADVKEETLKARKKYPWRPFPPQSTINLNVVQLLTPSTSALPTVSESHSNGDGRIVTSPEGTTTPIPNQAEQVDAPKHRGGDGVGHAKSAAPSTAELHAHINNDPGNAQMEVPIEIAVDEAVARHTDWVHVSASFSRRPNDELPTPQQGLILGGSVSLEPPTIGRECGRTFHAADIPSDRELVLERDADDDRHQLSLVVIGSLGESIRIRCRWLVS